jgi:hypothetical protein
MTSSKFLAHLLPGLAIAALVSLAPLAHAQSTTTGSSMAPSSSMSKTMKMSKTKKTASAKSTGGKLAGEEFTTEAMAKAHCPTDSVVWVNNTSHVSHASTSKYFGKTKHGSYACSKAAAAAGYKASKS